MARHAEPTAPPPADGGGRSRDALYETVAAAFSGAIARLARGYEADPEAARDLEQDMHLALWRSLEHFRGDAKLSTWVWQVAHNTGSSHVESRMRHKRKAALVPLDGISVANDQAGPEVEAERSLTLEKLYAFIHRLRPADRQVMLLYLEDIDAASIAEITGLSPGAVATRIHRIKSGLAGRIESGATS